MSASGRDVFNRLYATKKQTLNKTNSFPMFHPRPLLKKNGFNSAPQESNMQENVFNRLYRPPSVVKFAKSELNINQKSKHLQPFFKRVENFDTDSISEKGFKNPQREYQRLEEEKNKYKGTLRSPRSELQRVNKLGKNGKRLVNRSDNELQKLIDIENNSEEELEKFKDKSRADGNDAAKHSEGILQNLKSKVTGIKDAINYPGSELKKQKNVSVEKVQGQDSSNTHQVDLTAEEELGEKPFIVLSIIERINPFRGRMGKNKSKGAESKDKQTNSNANNSKTNANLNSANVKTGKTSNKEKNAKTNNAKVKGVENNKTKDKDKSTKQQEKETGSETGITDEMQLFGGYQPHKISKEKIKIRNELLDENRRSSLSYMNGDDQLPLPVNLEDTLNSPEWNNDYYLKDDEEEKKKKLSQPAWYNPPTKERHRAGYDSGRTQSNILNDREKHKLFLANKQTSSKSNSRVREVNYDEDNSGVYRAKMRKDSQAQMINENENTAVELPLDELDAEEIKDEEIIPLTRKPARELHSNIYDENSSMDASHPSVQLYVDEKDPGANSKNRLCNSPKEQRDAWCNEMRKLKDRILSKIHNSSAEETLTKIDITEELNRSSIENTTRQRPLKNETHRLGKDQWVKSPVKKCKSKLRKPRIFTNKSTSSCASDATTYTVESSSSSDNARQKSSTEETTDSSKLPVVRTIRHSTYCKSTTDQSTPLIDTSPTASSPQTSTQSYDPCFGESATTTNDSYVNDLSISDMNSYRELFNKTYIFDRDSLEDILGLQMPTVENSDSAFDELPSGNIDFPTSNSFRSSVPFVQCGSDRMTDKQSVKNYKNSFMSNGINHININGKCYTTGAEDGRQLKYFHDEIDLDSLK